MMEYININGSKIISIFVVPIQSCKSQKNTALLYYQEKGILIHNEHNRKKEKKHQY